MKKSSAAISVETTKGFHILKSFIQNKLMYEKMKIN